MNAVKYTCLMALAVTCTGANARHMIEDTNAKAIVNQGGLDMPAAKVGLLAKLAD